MPSRAGADGLGAFSYYDHVYLPESQKELVWSHRGVRYKTQLVFRVNGKRKTEAFLFDSVGGAWRPVVLRDGTPVDGKVDTYERAVAEILGPAETFFASVFSAQGKRPLSAYKNGEIKTLLADLLGLEEVRARGARAAEVAKLLKSGLGVIRQEQAQAAEALATLARHIDAGEGLAEKVDAARQGRQQAAEREVEAKAAAALVEAAGQAASSTEARRAELQANRGRIEREHGAALAREDQEAARITQRLQALQQRIATRQREHGARRQRLDGQVKLLRQVAGREARVRWARRRLPLAEAVAAACAARASQALAEVARLEGLRSKQALLRQEIEAMDREAGQLALRQADLARRFGLVERVPCVGTDLQGRCLLLGDAREAQVLVPTVDGQLSVLGARKQHACTELQGLTTELAAFGDACELRNRCEARLEAAQARAGTLVALAGTADEVRQAAASLAALEDEMASLPQEAAAETTEEAGEREEHEASRRRLAEERTRSIEVHAHALASLAQQLQALPAPFDQDRLAQARRASSAATEQLRAAEAAELAAVRKHEQWLGLGRQAQLLREQQTAIDERARHVERELSAWTLLAKCLSNDGVIALDIDDAGPTFSALANDLLLACYGVRFTLEVITQTATAKGELREDFDIIVHDGLRGESKSLKLVSGGERVWISCRSRHEIHYAENPDMPSARSGRRPGPCNCAAGTCEAMRHNTCGSGTMSPDARGGKSLSLMSGGERTFIDACLTRAIALYLAQNTGRRFDTLFSDEADGPLDPEHKRMFMAMKREVLRLGGYRQEFFITQTPHLAAMADAIIDLDAMRVDVHSDVALVAEEARR